MDIVLLILAGLCMLIGIAGCIIPGLPGMPIAYAGLWLAQITDRVDFSWQMLLGTKTFGGTKYGVWGSTIGVFVGLFFGVFGVILGPLVGAIVGEMLGGKALNESLKAGWGSFLGIFFGTVIKLIGCGLMLIALIQAIW